MTKGRSRWHVVAIVLAVAGVVGVSLAPDRQPESAPPGLRSIPDVEEPARVTVHVSGWVLRPGIVHVPEGSLVAEAIVAAGGARPGAALDQINLASPVLSGDQIEVQGPGGVTGADVPGIGGPLDLNRADLSELETLPGVGPVLAGRILEYRESNGPFSAVEDLLDVSGIGESKLASLADLVTVR